MIELHVRQFDGGDTRCDGRNCAAASAAMAIWHGSAGKVRLTADQVRAQSGRSCVPGVHTRSGGLAIGDVVRVAQANGVAIDYGEIEGGYTRWSPPTAQARLSSGFGGIFLGDYDQVPAPFRQPGSTFNGDHSLYGHDYREDLPAYGRSRPEPTVCWHDTLRQARIRVPMGVLIAYWQKPDSPVRGFAGWVREAWLPDTSTEEEPMSIYARREIGGTFTIPAGKLVRFLRPTATGWEVAKTRSSTPTVSGRVAYVARLGRLAGTTLPSSLLLVDPAHSTYGGLYVSSADVDETDARVAAITQADVDAARAAGYADAKGKAARAVDGI